MRVLNIGSLNIDYVYHVDHFVQPWETLSSASFHVNCGGKGLNQSIALARAGVDVWHAGMIGANGSFLREKLAENGVHTELVREIAESTGHAIIQVERSGQNSILLYSGANRCLTESFIDETLGQFTPGDLVLLQNETACVGYAISRGKERGMRVALNAAPAGENLRQMPLELLDVLLVNEVEGAYLAEETDPEAIAFVLTEKYPDTTLILTLGEAGAIAAQDGQTVHVPAMRVPAVDTTAAGDTFTGYCLRGILEGKPLEDCLGLGAAASALAVTRKGAADSVPYYDEAAAYLAGEELMSGLPPIERIGKGAH